LRYGSQGPKKKNAKPGLIELTLLSTSIPTPFNAPPALINEAANDSLRFSKEGDRGEGGAEGKDELGADDAVVLGGRTLFATGKVGGCRCLRAL